MEDFSALPQEFRDSPGFLFIQLAKIIKKMVDEELKPFELQPHEYGLLKIVTVEGSLPQHNFGERFGIDKASVTEIVEHLEKRDLIYRNKSHLDGRVKMLNITSKGSAVHARATRAVNKVYKKFLEPIETSDWEQTKETVLKLLIAHHK